MAQRMTAQSAETEATRLLQMALAILDQAESYLASANVARALDVLASKHAAGPSDDADLPDTVIAFSPSWGTLVDR